MRGMIQLQILKYSLKTLMVFAVVFGPSLSEAKQKKKKATEVFQVEILRCHDGDTCTGMTLPKGPNQEKIKIRFAGIDAPELKQKHGPEARDFLEARIKGRDVHLECQGSSYDRRTCVVFEGDDNINALLVKEGWAWDSPKYSKGAHAELQLEAAEAERGMWREPPSHSPFCFRHQKNEKCRFSQIFNP